MRCSYDSEYVQKYNDNCLSDENRGKFEQHLEKCPQCKGLLKGDQTLLEVLMEKEPEEAVPIDQILSRIDKKRYHSRKGLYIKLFGYKAANIGKTIMPIAAAAVIIFFLVGNPSLTEGFTRIFHQKDEISVTGSAKKNTQNEKKNSQNGNGQKKVNGEVDNDSGNKTSQKTTGKTNVISPNSNDYPQGDPADETSQMEGSQEDVYYVATLSVNNIEKQARLVGEYVEYDISVAFAQSEEGDTIMTKGPNYYNITAADSSGETVSADNCMIKGTQLNETDKTIKFNIRAKLGETYKILIPEEAVYTESGERNLTFEVELNTKKDVQLGTQVQNF